MSKLFECVPNFSEGKRPEIVEKIVSAISGSSCVDLIDYSMDIDHNRCVITFIGTAEDIKASILAGVKVAIENIDLNEHKGGHPRIGAADVIPIIPMKNATMDDAVELSRQIGAEIAEIFRIPVYLYEKSATSDYKKNLANIRKGGFNKLNNIELSDKQKPDYGPSRLHPTAGAVVIGARKPLIAFNVNLTTSDIKPAQLIASAIRKQRNTNPDLKGVKAIAIYLKSKKVAQVSTNITEPDSTDVCKVFTFIKKQAELLNVDILESELIGAIFDVYTTPELQQCMFNCSLSDEKIIRCNLL